MGTGCSSGYDIVIIQRHQHHNFRLCTTSTRLGKHWNKFCHKIEFHTLSEITKFPVRVPGVEYAIIADGKRVHVYSTRAHAANKFEEDTIDFVEEAFENSTLRKCTNETSRM